MVIFTGKKSSRSHYYYSYHTCQSYVRIYNQYCRTNNFCLQYGINIVDRYNTTLYLIYDPKYSVRYMSGGENCVYLIAIMPSGEPFRVLLWYCVVYNNSTFFCNSAFECIIICIIVTTSYSLAVCVDTKRKYIWDSRNKPI